MRRVEVKKELIRWARERSGLTESDLTERFPKFEQWERGEAFPTLKQLEAYAKKTLTPFGYFFLPEPPEEKLPIPDFRTVRDRGVRRPSPNLLETIYAMQRRQVVCVPGLVNRLLALLMGAAPRRLVRRVSGILAHRVLGG